MAGGGEPRPLATFTEGPVHAVAGIGHPERFFRQLRSAGLQVLEQAFPDHHAYVSQDLAFSDDRPVLMTEKDAIKCERFARPGLWSIPVTAQLGPAFGARLQALLPTRPARPMG
jgi:tetraacyldisaccharide 4'-kinase